MSSTITLTNTSVSENPKDGQLIGTLEVTGAASGETFTYTLADSVSGRFELKQNEAGSWELHVKTGGSLFDFESPGLDHFDVSVSATSNAATGGTTVHETSFSIDVTDVNEAPTDLWLHTLSAPSVAEHAAAGTEIGPLQALDPDRNDTVAFSLLDDAGGRFMLDSTGQKLLVADGSKIDFSPGASYQVKVEATDAGGLTFEKTLTIGVTDVVDTIGGSARNDRIFGTDGNDVLSGGAGNDKIFGFGGDDTLDGGPGKDILYGGTGRDTFHFDTLPKKGQFDMVMDFTPADDTLEFSLSSLLSLSPGGRASPHGHGGGHGGGRHGVGAGVDRHGHLNKKFFTVGDHPKDQNDDVYYNRKNGFVYFDPDGSGHQKSVVLLKLKPHLGLTADDFHFV